MFNYAIGFPETNRNAADEGEARETMGGTQTCRAGQTLLPDYGEGFRQTCPLRASLLSASMS